MEKSLTRLKKLTNRQKGRGSDKDVKKPEWHWKYLAIFPAWVLFSFIASIAVVSGVLWVMEWLHISLENSFSPAAYQTIISAKVYLLALAIAAGVPYWLNRNNKTTLSDLGLSRLMSWSDIGLAPVAFLAYILVAAVTLGIVTSLLPEFPADEVQEIGFSLYGPRLDVMLAFLTLVVVAPVAEEVLFRGYLYGKLKAYVPAVIAAVFTSLAFAAVHLQWNVAIDVFILSMFLCGLRSLTGSLWASILVHMLKNGVAYYILMNPVLGA